MTTVVILPHPGENAVFFEAARKLFLSELSLCAARLDAPGENVRECMLGGVKYYAVDMPRAPLEADLLCLSRLSGAYALYCLEGELLRPLPLLRRRTFGEDLSAILKYSGKTNALFTRWMLQMAALSLREESEPLRVLDPVAGRGTTLFEAAMLGWEAAGVELLRVPAHDTAVYFRKYLQQERWKHTLREEKRFGAPTWDFRFAREKEALAQRPGRLTVVCGDSAQAPRYFGKGRFDIVLGDLPYGVQHGSVAGGAARERTPRALLGACLPAWRECLRPGGVLALSWNAPTLAREAMEALLRGAGFSPLDSPPYRDLAHRVDASILRDAVFCVRA